MPDAAVAEQSRAAGAEGAAEGGEAGDGRCSGEGRKQGIPSLVNHRKSVTQLPDLEKRVQDRFVLLVSLLTQLTVTRVVWPLLNAGASGHEESQLRPAMLVCSMPQRPCSQ